MAKVKIIKKGKVVASAQNLEVLGRYHRAGRGYTHPVTKSSATKIPGGRGLLKVKYSDGATCQTEFADYGILKRWLATKRKRSGWG